MGPIVAEWGSRDHRGGTGSVARRGTLPALDGFSVGSLRSQTDWIYTNRRLFRYPCFCPEVRRERMDVTAQLSSKGQLTVPKAVRDALGLVEGDQVVFRVEGRRALIARTPSLLDLAGSVPVPAQKRGTPWPEVRRRTREARAKTRT
jgi:antitoxin PrlF